MIKVIDKNILNRDDSSELTIVRIEPTAVTINRQSNLNSPNVHELSDRGAEFCFSSLLESNSIEELVDG